MLQKMGDAIFKGEDPNEIKYNIRTQEVIKDDEDYLFSLYMPFVNKEDLDLNQKGDELIIKAGNVKRTISLPRTLTSLTIKGAKFEDEKLLIRFGGKSNDKWRNDKQLT